LGSLFIVGRFKYGKKHGFGIMKFSDGSIYEGEFKNDEMNG
jgi:hypothetical protein